MTSSSVARRLASMRLAGRFGCHLSQALRFALRLRISFTIRASSAATSSSRELRSLNSFPRCSPQCLRPAHRTWARSLRRIFSGGEPLASSVARDVIAAWKVPLVNLYGPTETTIQITSHSLQDTDLHQCGRSDRPSDLEHAGLRFGRRFGACTCWCERGALHCGFWSGAGLCGSCGADGGAVCCGPVWCCGEPDVPHRGPWRAGAATGCWSSWGVRMRR